jgi:omega-6 fatty acid desaturase (delta-12 desaturase)
VTDEILKEDINMNDLHLKQLRAAVAGYAQPSTGLALTIFTTDMVVYIAAIAGVIFLENIFLRIICSLVAGLLISLLFVVAHDAAHNSFAGSRLLNRVIARMAFLPCLHNYSLWLIAHNRWHHKLTNLKGSNSWSPLSRDEYEALPAWRKLVERFYRNPGGICFNYLTERWWKNKFFPYARITMGHKAGYWFDFMLVVSYLTVFLGFLVYAGSHLAHTSPAGLIILGFIIPLLYASFMIGSSVYQQHTHESIPWFKSAAECRRLGRTEKVTMHVRFPQWYNLLSHNVMEHTAHHVDPGIPLYNLSKAQKVLSVMLGTDMTTVGFSFKEFLQTMEKCKLYDYDHHRWLDFAGRATSEPILVNNEFKYKHAA